MGCIIKVDDDVNGVVDVDVDVDVGVVLVWC
jgi:hypothetical protein